MQPLILVSVLAFWYFNRDLPAIYPLVVVSVQLLLGILEHGYPARRDWMQPAREKRTNISIVVVISIGTLMVALWYSALLAAPLSSVREALHLDIWPLVWRASGHGAHHSFKRPGAINFGANHPLEMFLLVLPSAIVWDRLFGTSAEGPIFEAGTGPTEPSLWAKVMMPFREPRDTAIAPR
ncbi:MAG: hypothetical protein KDI31_14440 [Pseudomonadales bacterium]|nr:hypothetical protein [Pseudomonadales bacterium]